MSLLIGILRFVLLLLVVRFAIRAFNALMRPRQRPAAPRQAQPASADAGHLVRDRVCNTFVPQSRALSASIHGNVEHFCSEACREKALAALARAS